MESIGSPYLGRRDFTPIEERDDEDSKLNITPQNQNERGMKMSQDRT